MRGADRYDVHVRPVEQLSIIGLPDTAILLRKRLPALGVTGRHRYQLGLRQRLNRQRMERRDVPYSHDSEV